MMDSSKEPLHNFFLFEKKPRITKNKSESRNLVAYYQYSAQLKREENQLRTRLRLIENEQQKLRKEAVELDKLKKFNQSGMSKTSVPKTNYSIAKVHTISQMSKKCFSDNRDKTTMDIDNPEFVNKLDINLDLGLPENKNFEDEEFECG
ncbi:hypothetical protein LSTR_LSTR005420 [Laodelphax striatellus]|uniref:Uncharacterized protein n=1 Tax=Laodelphax striatellus TaxID=195883 RepID=A0A482WY00_LAOST|nr:hypothetical protein LSTR_LSTR005420 [Laodelphax striatellus]